MKVGRKSKDQTFPGAVFSSSCTLTHLRFTSTQMMAEITNPNVPIDYYSHGLRDRFRIDAYKLQPPAVQKDQPYADIDYQIDEAKYLARSQARSKAAGLEAAVPSGWPKTLRGPLVWTGADFSNENEYVLRLGHTEKAEIQAALEHFKSRDTIFRT